MSATDEDLRLLRESVRTLLDRAGGVGRARAVRDAGRGHDAGVLVELAEAGVLGAAVPEAAGGLGLGLAAAGVVAEEAGRVLAPEPLAALAGLAAGLLHRLCAGHPLLAAVLAGQALPAVAWQERGPQGPAVAIACRLAGGRLDGAKAWVAGIAGATHLLVLAEGAAGPVLALADPGATGVTIARRRQSDGSDQGEVRFERAAAEVLAEGPAVAAAMAAAAADATALAAAELVGLSGRALEITLDYIRTREQFDRPIGSFQVIQHRAVDLHIAQEVSAAAVREALARMDASAEPALRARQASRAKARAVTAARQITRQSIQLHGAVGYTDEFDIGLFLNRALVLSAWLGDDAHHRRLWLEARTAAEGVA